MPSQLGHFIEVPCPITRSLADQNHALLATAYTGNSERVNLRPSEPTHTPGEDAEINVLASAPTGVVIGNLNSDGIKLGHRKEDSRCDARFEDTHEVIKYKNAYTGKDVGECRGFVEVCLE